MNELRAEALRRAADDSRLNSGLQAAPEVVVKRAKSYLDFLLGTRTTKERSRKR